MGEKDRSATKATLLVFGLVAMGITIVMLLQSISEYLRWVAIGVFLIGCAFIWHKWAEARERRKQLKHQNALIAEQVKAEQDRRELERKEREQALRLEHERWQLEQHVTLTRILPDQRGFYPYLREEQEIIPLPPFHQARIAQTSVREEQEEQSVISEPARILTFAQLLEQGIIQEALSRDEPQMVLGYHANGDIRYGSWLDLYSAAVGGVSGGGKTTTVRFLLYQAILSGAKLVMVDPHIRNEEESLAAQFKCFKNVHLFPPCDESPEPLAKRVRWLLKEGARRLATGKKGQSIIYVLDEYNAINRRLPDELRRENARLLVEIAQEYRKFGIFAMVIGQRWAENDLGGKDIGATIRSSLATQLAHRFSDQDQAKKLIGSPYHSKCLRLAKGHYWFADTDGAINEMVTPDTKVSDGAIIQRLLDAGSTTYNSPVSSYDATTRRLPKQTYNELPVGEMEPLQKAREATTDPLTPTLPIELETKIPAVIAAMMEQKLQLDILREIWMIDQAAGSKYAKARNELLQVQATIMARYMRPSIVESEEM